MKKNYKIGIIGLGKIGYRITERLIEKGYTPVAMDINNKIVKKIEKKGAIGVNSFRNLANNLLTPRIILLSVPSGDRIDKIIKKLIPYLSNWE